jgi:hypothetical protein
MPPPAYTHYSCYILKITIIALCSDIMVGIMGDIFQLFLKKCALNEKWMKFCWGIFAKIVILKLNFAIGNSSKLFKNEKHS